jgi:hypothetical protein
MATSTDSTTLVDTAAGRKPDANDQPFVPSGQPNQLPGEVFKADANTWYHLAVHYTDRSGKPASSYIYPLGQNPATSFWDYMAFNSPDGLKPAKFKIHPPKANGFSEWELDDGNFLCLKATGYMYRASAYRVGWALSKGHLYTDYRWDGPTGYKYDDVLVPSAYYIGMDLPAFTCELVPA